ncbi:MAG: flippase-like domain-containing protein [Candidatus Rokubacteria bacterium]|nr:flippase-like domain-containing protein [Candidatus Rokubacteria bacterium]
MRAIRFLLLGCGAALLAVLVVRIGPAAVLSSFSQLSWRLLLVLCFPFSLMMLFDTLGWRFAFRRDLVPFPALLSARLAGEAFNLTTPTASVGGEAVKAWLLRPHVPLDDSVPSVIIAKTTITIAQGAFLLLGIACALSTLQPGLPLVRGMEWLLAVEIIAVSGFVLVQVGGVMGGVSRVLNRLGLPWASERSEALRRLDGVLLSFYQREPRRLFLSIACHFVGWALGALETYLILRFLGVPVPLVTAAVIEAFGTAVRFATFFVPASLGVLEGGQVAAFVALGLGATPGISFSLVRRVREVAWVGIGLIALAAMRPASRLPAGREREG